ncbi:MAG TPA: class I SAM-dependent methyltransferase [Planctomycetes bacterium]|nr:class I SAM-dependent methyltransferase [Planctomycetota bacterium]
MGSSSAEVRGRWQASGTGTWYDAQRWSRNRERDPRTVDKLLSKFLPSSGNGYASLLDAPCGTGRLRATIEHHGSFIGLDASLSMLAAARRSDPSRLLAGDVERLPFADRTFDAAISCRLLHHLMDPDALARAVRELVRVSKRLVLASFWDAGTLEARRRRLPLTRRPRHRGWHSRGEIRTAFGEAGAETIHFEQRIRFVSQQTWVVARCGGSRPS